MFDDREFLWAIEDGDVDKVKHIFQCHPEVRRNNMKGDDNQESWVAFAVRCRQMEVLATLLSLGFSINSVRHPEEATALTAAVEDNLVEFAEFLLSRGADPNIGDLLLAAMGSQLPLESQVVMLKLLLTHGANVNKLFPLFGDWSKAFTALDHAPNDTVRKLLIEHGALPSRALKDSATRECGPQTAERKHSKHGTRNPSGENDLTKAVVAYFEEHFGPVEHRSVIEVVPCALPISIHLILPAENRDVLTVFTTGMSARKCETSEGTNVASFAELFMQLPQTWEILDFKSQAMNWPLVWLRRLAKYPHENGSWLERPISIVSNAEPPEPIAPHVRFSSFLLVAEREVQLPDGNNLDLFRVFPIYPEERQLEMTMGIPALMRAFDEADISFVVDTNRRNAGLFK